MGRVDRASASGLSAEGDGRIDVGDTIVVLRAAVGLQLIECER